MPSLLMALAKNSSVRSPVESAERGSASVQWMENPDLGVWVTERSWGPLPRCWGPADGTQSAALLS